MSLAILFHFLCADELPHWSFVLGSLYVGDLVWLGLSSVRVAGFSLQHVTSSWSLFFN